MPIHDVIAGACGLAIGLILANLLGEAFSKIPIVGDYIPVIFSIVLGYLGIHITIKKRKEIAGLFDFLPHVLKEISRNREAKSAPPVVVPVPEVVDVEEFVVHPGVLEEQPVAQPLDVLAAHRRREACAGLPIRERRAGVG